MIAGIKLVLLFTSAENALKMAAKMAATKMSSVTELFFVGWCFGRGFCICQSVVEELFICVLC